MPVYMKMTSYLAKFTYFWILFLVIELGWYGAKWLEYPYPQIRSKSNKIYILAPRWAHCISQCQFLSNFCFFRVTVRSHIKDTIVISKRTEFRQNFQMIILSLCKRSEKQGWKLLIDLSLRIPRSFLNVSRIWYFSIKDTTILNFNFSSKNSIVLNYFITIPVQICSKWSRYP